MTKKKQRQLLTIFGIIFLVAGSVLFVLCLTKTLSPYFLIASAVNDILCITCFYKLLVKLYKRKAKRERVGL